MKRAAVIAIAAAGLVVVGAALWLWLSSRAIGQLDARYHQVQRGMSTSEVARIMGHVGEWRESEFKAWWDDQPLGAPEDARIRKAVRYSVSTFYLPVSFDFTFDADGKVVGRHRYD